MDLIRNLLGDEKLNYLGFSYGTWLGAWYAKRFPEHVGNMVLDANADVSATWQDIVSARSMGNQRGFEDVVAPYLARNNAVFGLGETKEDVYESYDVLADELKVALQPFINQTMVASRNIASSGQVLLVAQGIQAILEEFGTPTRETFETFLERVAAYSFAEDAETNAALSTLATTLASSYLGILFPPTFPFLTPLGAVNTAVQCNDSVWNQTPEFYAELGTEQDERYPFVGGSETFQPCAFWGEASASMPETPENMPAVLLVQSGYDPSTPAEGALRAFESLPGAKLIYVENELSHTVFPYDTDCVDAKVAGFLLNGSLPEEDISNCDAKALPGETDVFAPGTAPSVGDAVTTQGMVKAAAPTGENELYDLVHEMMNAKFH